MSLNLKNRQLVGELMDAPDLPASDHHHALKGLQRVNQFSRTARVISTAIIHYCREHKLVSLRVLDLACGGGDVTMEVAKHLQQSGINAEMHGWDRSQTAIDFARKQTENEERAEVTFDVAEALADASNSCFDVVYCTLFLHHLSEAEAEQLLKAMWRKATRLVLIDDLRRSVVGYTLAVIGCQLLSRSPIVHVDGPLSVRAAFTETEILGLSDRCDLARPSIKRHWPYRILVAWAHP